MKQFVGSHVVYIRRTNDTKGMTEIAFYDGETEWVTHTPDQLLNETLRMLNSSLTASRESMKSMMKYTQYAPVIIDAPLNLVFFPLHTRDSYEMWYINSQHYLQAIDYDRTTIYFTNGRSLTVDEKASHIMKCQNKALLATDFYSKVRKRFL
ncbi:competence protein ComK [Macrococcus carouselicus]|nr:competence protein ComK [Macrococcus carouselicus]